jgi:hypothetical protein
MGGVKMKLVYTMLLVAGLIPSVALADYAADKKKYDECVTQVKKDYPVPPGNINAQNQMVRETCGSAPTPPSK